MPPRTLAFTSTARGLANVLWSPCRVGPVGADSATFPEFGAVWDTGATGSAITQKVIDQCGLKPIGRSQIFHAGTDDEPDETDVYLVDIALPNSAVMKEVEAGRSSFRGGDVLIGMDIICAGDFAVTNSNNRTQFTFQLPPQAEIDFTKAQPLPAPRNRAERRARARMGH